MHVAFVHSEHRRTQQARRQSCKIDETRRLRYSLLREISREECRKHQSADDEGGRNGHLSEYIESVKTKDEDHRCDCKRHSEGNVTVYASVHKASCRGASYHVQVDGGEIKRSPCQFLFHVRYAVVCCRYTELYRDERARKYRRCVCRGRCRFQKHKNHKYEGYDRSESM